MSDPTSSPLRRDENNLVSKEESTQIGRGINVRCDDNHQSAYDVTDEKERETSPTDEQIRKIFKDVNLFISDYGSNLISIVMEDGDEPFLNVISRKVDQFLIDQSCLRLNIKIMLDFQISARLYTSNRELIQEIFFPLSQIQNNKEFMNLLDTIDGNSYKSCVGFTLKYSSVDCSQLLYEKYDGNLIYRSKKCTFIVDMTRKHLKVFGRTLCAECHQMSVNFGLSNENSKCKRRGRPKGRKNYLCLNSIHKDQTLNKETTDGEIKRVDKAFVEKQNKEEGIKENIDGKLNQFNEDANSVDNPKDFTVLRRGLRKRNSTGFLNHTLSKKYHRDISSAETTKCPDCHKEFSSFKDYKDHCIEHEGVFPCYEVEDCIKRFKSQKDLDIHVRKHKGDKPYTCSVCEKDYLTKQDLKIHSRKHTGEKPFQCDICFKTFARNQQRKIHMAVHTGERAYLCPECGSSFGSMSTLIDHRKRRHMELRNHKCTSCSKAFFTRQELEAHSRTHTGEKPFQCMICGKSFSRTHHLKRHTHSVHKQASSNKTYISRKKEVSTAVLIGTDEEDNLEATEYIVENQSYSSELLVHQVEDGNESIQYVSGSSLIQLSQMSNEENQTILIPQDAVVEISGESDTRYVVIEGEDGGTKLVEYTPAVQEVNEKQ